MTSPKRLAKQTSRSFRVAGNKKFTASHKLELGQSTGTKTRRLHPIILLRQPKSGLRPNFHAGDEGCTSLFGQRPAFHAARV